MLRLLAYAAIYLFWGGSFLAIRDIVAVTPPFFAAGFRFVCAGAALYLLARARGASRPGRRQWWHSFGMGVVMFGGNYACPLLGGAAARLRHRRGAHRHAAGVGLPG